jgi:hypothetical protein
MPGIVEEQRALGADHLELVAIGHVDAAVEMRHDVAGEAHGPGEADVHAVPAGHLLARHLDRLAGHHPRAAHAVAPHVHQGAALELGRQPHVVGVV